MEGACEKGLASVDEAGAETVCWAGVCTSAISLLGGNVSQPSHGGTGMHVLLHLGQALHKVAFPVLSWSSDQLHQEGINTTYTTKEATLRQRAAL